MLRRTLLRRAYEQFEGHISGDKGHMTLQQACTIFGYQMNEEWTKPDIKKRFQKLALRFHPDNGGTGEQFQLLKEAQQLLLTHRRDKGADASRGAAKQSSEINFRRMNYDNLTNTIHRQTADHPEYRSFSLQDFVVFFVFLFMAVFYYCYTTYKTQMRVLSSRWSYSEENLPHTGHGSPTTDKAWHPWRADGETRDRMDDIALLQGSVRREIIEEKRRASPPVYTPWQSGGPFARHSVLPHLVQGSDESEDKSTTKDVEVVVEAK